MFSKINKIESPGARFLKDEGDQVKIDGRQPKILTSKVSKQIKKIKEPVPRYFESLNQIQGYWSEGEYDLIEIFKFLKFEAYFLKSVQKKTGQLIKSGYSVRSDEDAITEYLDARFALMELQTGVSLAHIIEKLAYYLFTCSNAFLIKVRDPDFEHATSYKKDAKEFHPVTGLFLVHPTQLKPRFQWVKFSEGKMIKHKLELTKWIFVNRRGLITEFDPDDVAHFTLLKEDGMIFGTPEVIPVIDDIKTLRKMEEDLQLLAYRDLFPIIHYTVENPGMIEHLGGVSELDQAKKDLDRMMQDGGIATDARHEIKYIGSQGKHMELRPYLEYFRDRVFSGLGVSATDMGIGKDIGGTTATAMSSQLMDSVKYAQQELTRQFDEMILTELMLQSPFGPNGLKKGIKPTLAFEEIDLDWKIKQENHQADQFTKGVHTLDEVRNMRGAKTLSDDQLKRTHPHLYGDFSEPAVKAQKEIKSAAERDSVKSAKSNSNITKSKRPKVKNRDDAMFSIQDEDISLAFTDTVRQLIDTHPVNKKFSMKAATAAIYDRIKDGVVAKFTEGMQDAVLDLELDSDRTFTELAQKELTRLIKEVDRLCDDVTLKLCDNNGYLNKASVRIATANRTEQIKARNYGYAIVCLENGINSFSLYRYDSDETIDNIEVKEFIRDNIPPLHPNSKILLRAKIDKAEEE